MSNSWFNISTCNYRSSSIIQWEAISLSTTAIAQNDDQATINGKLQGQINYFIPNTATGTIPTTTNTDIPLITFPNGKTVLNGKIFVQELWVERGSGEWFSTNCPNFGGNWSSFAKFTRTSITSTLYVWFSSYPSSGWTRNFRLDYLQLP